MYTSNFYREYQKNVRHLRNLEIQKIRLRNRVILLLINLTYFSEKRTTPGKIESTLVSKILGPK